MQDNYNIIHCHTQLSNGTTIIDSIDDYTKFIDRAKECGMKSIVFTEHGNLLSWYHKKT
ncbi:PHP domain-containing protein, partial [Enterobacter asburiae]